jgi:eukaryotic-like serine/threonine-protein kinase
MPKGGRSGMVDLQSRIGQQIGEYRLLHRLGRGSFGTVYLAEHIHDGSQAAVKLLQLQLTRYEDLKGFLTEARTMRLHHPHIVTLLDFGLSQDHIAYLVMEYAIGGSLRSRHPLGTPLPLATINTYVAQLASALQYAHDHHVIHRDIKPQNILLRADGTLLLSDFGMAEVIEQSRLVTRPRLVGTPAYMAPEQSRGKPKPASDQYALAVLVYEWLTGRVPFQGSVQEVVEQHQFDTPPALHKLRPDLPSQIGQVLAQALAKKPEHRFATVEQFAVTLQLALAPLLSIRQTAQLRALSRMTPPTIPVISSGHTPTPPRSRLRKLPSRIELVVLACLLLLVGVGPMGTWMLMNQSRPQTASTVRATPVATNSYNSAIATRSIQFGFDPQHTHNNPYEQTILPSNASQLSEQWGFQAGLFIRSSPAVANGLVYVGSDDHKLYAIDASTGHVRWTHQTGGAIRSSPAIADGFVYIGSDDNHLYALDASSGQKIWSFQTGGAIKSSPTVANGFVYIGSDDNNLYALDASTGQKVWSFQTGGAIDSSPAVANGLVYIGSADDSLYALDASTGQKVWSFQTGGAIDSSPAVANGLVYIGSDDNNLYALDASTGQERWRFPTNGAIDSSPAIANGLVYIGSADDNLYALYAATGQKRWSYLVGSAITASPMIANGLVYIGSADDNLYALSISTGQKIWAYQTGGFIDSSPMIADGVVYVGSADDSLYAFGL